MGAERGPRTLPSRRWPFFLVASTFLAVLCATAWASGGTECPEGNLVPGARVSGAGIRGHARALADQFLPPEGTGWDSALAVVLKDPSASVTVDLGQTRSIGGLIIQADADDAYLIEGSRDGTLFAPLSLAPPVPGSGLRFRAGFAEGEEVRYLRVRASGGDGNYSIAELMAMCRVPGGAQFDAGFAAAAHEEKLLPWRLRAVKLAVALAATCFFLWNWLAKRRASPEAGSGRRDALLALLGVAGVLCGWNLVTFHGGASLHHAEFFHHFLGAKYFEELGYDRLYECTAAADAEAGLEEWVRGRILRDLRTNATVPGSVLLERAGECRAAFSPERWRQFAFDVAWFRTWIPPTVWERLLQDHGYNATPAWGLVPGLLTRSMAATDAGLFALAMIDPLLLLAMWLLLISCFGWRGAAGAAIWWGTNFLGESDWTAGAFLRQDWLLLTAIGVCLVRIKRWAAGGWALGWAAALRVYPAFFAAGLALKILASAWRRRSFSFERGHLRFAAGFAAAVVFFVAFSSAVNPSGVGSWVGFTENSRVDMSTRSTNQVGLGALLAYRPGTLLRTIVESGVVDPVNVWQEEKQRMLASRRWLQLAGLLAFAALLLRRVRDAEDWQALVLGAGLVTFAVDMTSYYAALFLFYGLLWRRGGDEVSLTLCALAAWTQCSLLIWPRPDQAEECYLGISLGLVAAVVLITALRAPGALSAGDGRVRRAAEPIR